MPEVVASKTFIGEDGQLIRRGQKFTADDKRIKALGKRNLIGGKRKDRADKTLAEMQDGFNVRRLRKAFRIFQGAGVIPAEASFDDFYADHMSRQDPERRPPPARRTQDKPEPDRRQIDPPLERKAGDEGSTDGAGSEGQGQEGQAGGEGGQEGPAEGDDAGEGGEGGEDAKEDEKPPAADPARRTRGNRPAE